MYMSCVVVVGSWVQAKNAPMRFLVYLHAILSIPNITLCTLCRLEHYSIVKAVAGVMNILYIYMRSGAL